jgi:hypothetical protein
MYQKNKVDFEIEKFKNRILQSYSGDNKSFDYMIEMLDIGQDFDKPDVIIYVIDHIPSLISYASLLLSTLKEEHENLVVSFEKIKSKKLINIRKKIFEINLKSGMTANNAKPTNTDVENSFNKIIDKDALFIVVKNKLDKVNVKIEHLKILLKFLDNKYETLRTIVSLLKVCIEKDIILPQLSKVKSKKISMYKIGKADK